MQFYPGVTPEGNLHKLETQVLYKMTIPEDPDKLHIFLKRYKGGCIMKKEAKQKSKLWLWLCIGAVALLAVGGGILALILGGGEAADPDAMGGYRPVLYWNVDRKTYTENSESGLSTREPGEDGLYHIRFAIDGQHVEKTVADKRLVNVIDSMDVMALSLDGDGQIVDVLEPKEVANVTVVGKSLYAQQIMAESMVANSSLAMNGMKQEISFCDLTQIYEVSGDVEPVGKIVDPSAIQPMDTVGIYANNAGEVTHVFVIAHPERSDIYWRADQFYNSSLKQTTRLPDEDGIYHMDFYCNGELVTLKTRDFNIVNHVDSRDRYACAKGFLFDEEGFVVGEIDPALGTRTVMGCERFDVTEIVDQTIYTAKLWNNDGSLFDFQLADDCVIYDVSTAALAEGRRGKPVDSVQVGDRITVWTNPEGKAVIIYVACRVVDVDMYYVPTLKYDSTLKETTRKPNSQGYYEVELLKVGETANRTFKTKDKALMSYLDSITAKTIGMKVNGDIIEVVYDSECLFGYTPLTRGGTVPSVSGSVFTRMTYGQPDSVRTSIMAGDCKIYNVSEVGNYGEETTLQPHDRIYAHKKPTGEAICIFVTQRRVGLDHLYWNITRMYDSATKSTTREPDADGYYVFEMIHKGKQVTLKTRSKSIASKIDAQSTCAVGLNVSGDVITKYFSALNTSGGSVTMSGYRVKEVRSDGVVVVYYNSGETYRERMFKIKSDGVIYNVSDAYFNYRGETVSSLKKGDMVLVVTDINAEAEVVYIRYREADNMYWRTDRYYDTTEKVTTREPDAEGWYHYDLAVDGTIKSFKTKDKELATKIDAISGAFGLVLSGDEIRSFVPTNWVRNVGFVGVTNWEVTAISGNKVTVKYNLPGSSNTGKTQTITLASGAKIFDVSPVAESFGAKAKLKVGDQIRTYQNEANTAHLYVYILHRANRAEGIDAHCDHCGQVVHWNPYAGGSITRAAGHYYLSGDCETNEQLGVGLEGSEYEIVLDLNGKTLTRKEGGRFALVRFGDTLTILDSVGGGKILCKGAEGWNGGVMYVDGGNVNLMGGTLEMDSTLEHKWGGVLYLSGSKFTMSGGTIVGGQAIRGGSIYNTGASTIEMSGGTITGGHCTSESGGNIYMMSDTTLIMTGGTISNGTSVGRGGNIHVDSAKLDISNATITGGTSQRSADGICINSSKSSIKLTNVTCDDTILVRYMGEFIVEGCVKLADLNVPSGKQFIVGALTEGSRIGVTAVGQFTTAFDSAKDYLDAGYFVSNVEKMEVGVHENALLLQSEKTYCAHCDQKVSWAVWNADTTIEGPSTQGEADHYYLEGDFTNHTAQRTVKGNVVLDLRGHSYTTTGIRNFLVSGNFSIMDSVGGGVMSADGSGDDGTIAYVNGDAGVFNLYGGTLKQGANPNVKRGGIIAINRGSVNIYGGTVEGGTVTDKGSAIWNNRYTTIQITGGTVTGSLALMGNTEKTAVLNISGGKLETVTVNDKVDVTLSGAPQIAHLDLTSGKKITLGELTDGTDVTVTAAEIFTEETPDAATYAPWFKSTDGQQVTADGNALRVGVAQVEPEPTFDCPHCDATDITWEVWPGTTKPASGHYYLEGDFTAQSAQFSINGGTDVVLDLRGHSYAPTGIRNFLIAGTFSIVDSVGGGYMSSDGANSDGTIAYLNGADATFKLYSGTLKQSANVKVKNGGLLAANRGTIAILGGELQGGVASANGSAIWNKRNVSVTIENATVTGSVYIVGDDERNASLNLNNAVVNGDVLVGDKVDVTVSGKTVASNLVLTGGKLINLGTLESGASIIVTADDGAITTECAKAADYAGFFHSTVEGKGITAQGNVLVHGEAVEEEKYPLNLVYEQAVKMTADGVFAATNADANGVVTADCPFCGAKNAQWNVLGAATAKVTLDGTPSHYYLKEDQTANTSYYNITGTVCLHLNGHNITTTSRVVSVDANGTLNIMGDGVISGSYSHATNVTHGSTMDVMGNLNLCGGTYVRTKNQPIITGRATLNDGLSSIINMYNGTMVQGDTTYTGPCVHISNSHIFNMYGGTITGGYNPDGNGGSIALVAGTYRNRVAQVNIFGGTVEKGTALLGGNIYVAGANKSNSKGTCSGVLTICGGTVKDGTATTGADVYVGPTTAYEKISASITGGTLGSVYICNGVDSFAISGAPVIGTLELQSGLKAELGELTADAKITVVADGEFTTANTSAQDYLNAGYIQAPAGKKITVTNGVMSMENETVLQALAAFFGI